MPVKTVRSRPIRICHIISGLNVGGAEMMLTRLVERTDKTRFAPEVVSLTDAGPLTERINGAGVSVHALGMRRGVPDPLGALRLAARLRQNPPDVVQTWLYHGDLIGGLAARLAGCSAIAWCIQNSDLAPGASRATTIITARWCARLSRSVPRRIVCVSERAKQIHVALGYDASRFLIIPNGVDTGLFRPDPAARAATRAEFGIPADAPLIGMAARYDPQKDHATFLSAAALLSAERPDARFLLCGSGVTPDNAALTAGIRRVGLTGKVLLAGVRADTSRLFPAFDIAALSSRFGEAFSLYLGEAMACGVPVVATDIGDSAYLVGDTGRIVPAADPEAMASAWKELLNDDSALRQKRGKSSRKRVTENFALEATVQRYAAQHTELASAL